MKMMKTVRHTDMASFHGGNLAFFEHYQDDPTPFIGVNWPDRDCISLCRGATTDVLEVERARSDGVQVMRLDHIPATEVSVILFPPGVMAVLYAFPQPVAPDDPGQEAIDAVVESAQSLGIGAAARDHSGRGNDIIVNGRKISGIDLNEITVAGNEWTVVGYFISLDLDFHLGQYITLPDEKFEGKFADNMYDRMGDLHREDPSITEDELTESFFDALGEHHGVDFVEETADVSEREAELAEWVKSDEWVFDK